MEFKIFLLIITSWLHVICGQHNYELVFFNEEIFSRCEKYPNNFLERFFDLTTLNIEQNEDGRLVANGYVTIKTTIQEPFPVSVELFKKQRGTWQPTVYSQMRDDTCTALLGETELWYSYFKDIPAEQRTCPFTEGQKLDFDINGPTLLSMPVRNAEGEYKIHAEAGIPNEEYFVCVDIFLTAHKM